MIEPENVLPMSYPKVLVHQTRSILIVKVLERAELTGTDDRKPKKLFFIEFIRVRKPKSIDATELAARGNGSCRIRQCRGCEVVGLRVHG